MLPAGLRGLRLEGSVPKRLVDSRDGTGSSTGKLGVGRDVQVSVVVAPITVGGITVEVPGSAVASHVVVDMSAYIETNASGGFVPSNPSRFVDTRGDTGLQPE
jgi:hypothetical protein